jgi:hypothetical protein
MNLDQYVKSAEYKPESLKRPSVEYYKPVYELPPTKYDEMVNQMPAAGVRRLPEF